MKLWLQNTDDVILLLSIRNIFQFKSLHPQLVSLNTNVEFISATEATVVRCPEDWWWSFVPPVSPTWPCTTPALLEGKSPGTTAPWTSRGGFGWAARSPACPCPAPAPRRRTTRWTTSTSTSDSPAVWGETPESVCRKPRLKWTTHILLLSNLYPFSGKKSCEGLLSVPCLWAGSGIQNNMILNTVLFHSVYFVFSDAASKPPKLPQSLPSLFSAA